MERILPPHQRLVDLPYVAEVLGIHPQTIRNRLGKNAEKPFPLRVKRIGRAVRFDRLELERYLDEL